ncbi:phospholipase [Pseudomonas brassicacearum]|uniref:1-phosphatidylinositol phosphodiesterase n=1 Tax=Pseudomonas brassicacearum TaxID=930166 RepID=A0A423GJT4_9PSED|nr:phospholipase [Pseudomonas brassicacearum]ROM90548.1 phospholipase [Pseudomonas brassicacearum]
MPQNTAGHLNKQAWMNEVLDIDTLKLTDIIWPGAHNCGMDKKAPNYDVVIGHWTTCQNDTFPWQLAQGVRAFDIRLGYKPGHDQDIFYFHHNGLESHRVLDELIDAVLAFLQRNPNEFIVLDFHLLAGGKHSFDYKKFNALLLRRLGHTTIPFAQSRLSIGQLKRASPHRRLVLAAHGPDDLDETTFWPRVVHKWSDKLFTDIDDLRNHIANTLSTEHSGNFLWSLSATSYSFLGGPVDIKNAINDWFHQSRDWVSRCCIINTDFVEESEIVRYCWIANSMKAVSMG